jgi:hypothetical protein
MEITEVRRIVCTGYTQAQGRESCRVDNVILKIVRFVIEINRINALTERGNVG